MVARQPGAWMSHNPSGSCAILTSSVSTGVAVSRNRVTVCHPRKLRPEILRDGQKAVTDKHGAAAEFDLVFHGGSGTPKVQLQETLDYGVVKMNIDTDTQYAFTRPVADFILKNYDQVMMIDGEIGSKKAYDPRTTLKLAEAGVAARLQRACDDLKSTGHSVFGKV